MVQASRRRRTTSVTAFADRLADAVERKRSQLVVGLDPLPELLPLELARRGRLGRREAAEACARFCRGVDRRGRRRTWSRVKPQLAFFEALGADGMEALRETSAPTRARPA